MSENLQNTILHLPASGPSEAGPLSADVYAIRGESAWWIFDVGACDEAAAFIDSLPCETDGRESVLLKKNIVISHFHRDHFFNLSRILFDNLYVGRETFRHCDETIQTLASCVNQQSPCKCVTVVDSPLDFEDGLQIRIEPIPSSHAKGSLMLVLGDDSSYDENSRGEQVAFLGDSTYPTVGHNKPDSYNVQLLFQQIQFLRNCPAQQYYMSHRRFAPREKSSILQVLESYYAMRNPNKNVIEISR